MLTCWIPIRLSMCLYSALFNHLEIVFLLGDHLIRSLAACDSAYKALKDNAKVASLLSLLLMFPRSWYCQYSSFAKSWTQQYGYHCA